MPFEFRKLEIPDVIEIVPRIFEDNRGFFVETYKFSDFAEFGIKQHFVQDNHSMSRKGTLRGLHYQKNPSAQAKLVRCIKGEILDIAVDLRKNSPSFARWTGLELSEQNKKMLYVPEGFAHGFLVLSPLAEIVYKTSETYSSKDDRGIRWNDPQIGIKWGIENPTISDKDKGLPLLAETEVNFVYENY